MEKQQNSSIVTPVSGCEENYICCQVNILLKYLRYLSVQNFTALCVENKYVWFKGRRSSLSFFARHPVHSPYVGGEYSLTRSTISSKRVLSYLKGNGSKRVLSY